MAPNIERLLTNLVAIVNLTREHRYMRINEDLHFSLASSSTCFGVSEQLRTKRLNIDGALIDAVQKGRLLVLVAHQDDETACAGLLQRSSERMIIYATNGAPSDRFFWDKYGSRDGYSSVRRGEAFSAAAKIGPAKLEFLQFGDQDLFRALDEAFRVVSDIVRQYKPNIILVPAYEGGHPDHDSCSFLGALLRRRLQARVWEMPLYHRSQTGKLICQTFRTQNGTECVSPLSRKELQIRDCVVASYVSQTDLRDFISGNAEVFRPQADYDYSRPPHEGLLNYEFWEWPVSGAQVCQAFKTCAIR